MSGVCVPLGCVRVFVVPYAYGVCALCLICSVILFHE